MQSWNGGPAAWDGSALSGLKAQALTVPESHASWATGTIQSLKSIDPTGQFAAAKYALRSLACRYRRLNEEVQQLETELERLTRAAAPALVSAFGVGPDTASSLLIAAGSNADRLRSEASFASLCGVNPIPASSGKTNRHRLNRGGDRQANAALYRIVVVRLRYEQRTQAYMRRRTAEGMTKTEVIRCLKRYVAREVYTAIQRPNRILDHAA